MAKLFSGLTLVVALVAIFFGFQSKEMVGKLQVAADRDHTDLLDTRTKLKKTEKERDDTKAELATTKEELSKTQIELTATKGDLEKKTAELTVANTELTASKAELADVKAKLKAIGDVPVDELMKQIADMKAKIPELDAKVAAGEKEITELKGEKEGLIAQKKETEVKIASQQKVVDRYQKNIMQKGIRGSVLAVNSGWGFCVLSIGDRQGAAANKIMVVARNGQAIGKVKIINVEASQSVADIIPASFTRGIYVQPGDDVIFTGEDKVREEPADAAGKTPAATAAPLGVPALPVQ